MAPAKRRTNDENAIPSFVDMSQPRKRHKAIPLSDATLLQGQLIADRQAKESAEIEQQKAQEKESVKFAVTERIRHALDGLAEAGYGSLHEFLGELFTTTDQQQSAQVSRMLVSHGRDVLDKMRAKRPDILNGWAIEVTGDILAEEGKKLASYLRPAQGRAVSDILENFSLDKIMRVSEDIAPNLVRLLRSVGTKEKSNSTRKNHDLVFVTVICMLAQSRNEHSNEFQTTTCIYLLSCGASRSQFDILNHAGFTCSYTTAIRTIKDLGKERLSKILGIVKSRAFMLVWDNLNIAFRVAEQRKDSKSHFDNGTTATLIPLFQTEFGELRLDLKPPRDTRLPVLDFGPEDLLPRLDQVLDLEAALLWHIEDILFEAFPDLRARFRATIDPPPSVLSIPVHKTEQYPLPAMHIDESSLDGTLEVVDTIIRKNLNMSEEDIAKHGIILCAGDQLTISLLDKASASRRDDTKLSDNIGRWTEGQLGLFHVKMAGDRMVTNEYWGVANSKSPWSLWKVNTLLARKHISAGWKAKKLPPFRETWELILRLALPANILDGFRLYCGDESLEHWVSHVRERRSIREVAAKVKAELCSARRVSRLRRFPEEKRDIPLENIILFNRDALILRELGAAIKRGDVGSVINVLAHWMVMFRGTGSMPKYADALFHLLVHLKQMHPKLRDAFLMNWLANLSGQPKAFKEIDLLQEHQNFWAKVVYLASGSNRSWSWLSMVTVSIFTLRDVIRQIKVDYKIPHNGTSHTSPKTEKDIQDLRQYLLDERIQSYHADRDNNKWATPARDLFVPGAAYGSTARAFKTFCRDTRNARNEGVSEGPNIANNDSVEEDTVANFDYGGNSGITIEDLAMDDEELPVGMDFADFVSLGEEMIEELSRYD